MNRKRRTRQHIIADLSVNYFEKQALLCGYAVERVLHDYGFDLVVWTYNNIGEIEPGQILVQLKATDSVNWTNNHSRIALRIDRRDLNLWLEYFVPVFLVLYEAPSDKAYWICIQEYFEKLGDQFDITRIGQTYTVYFEAEDILNENAVKMFAEYKRRATTQLKAQSGDISYEI